MPILLEHGGKVDLWAGWAITLPPSYHQLNEDGSWSCWGADWAIDVNIIEVGGDASGAPASAKNLLGQNREINFTGVGCIGEIKLLKELDDGREVFRLVANLAATNTSISCWVSYFNEQQHSFAEEIVHAIVHSS